MFFILKTACKLQRIKKRLNGLKDAQEGGSGTQMEGDCSRQQKSGGFFYPRLFLAKLVWGRRRHTVMLEAGEGWKGTDGAWVAFPDPSDGREGMGGRTESSHGKQNSLTFFAG